MKAFFVAYAALAYLVFLASFLYAVAFVGNLSIVPKTIDSGVREAVWSSLIVNLVLLGAFAVQHSVMARPAFKRWFTRFVPVQIERSTYVLAASLLLMLLFAVWRPMPDPVWTIESPLATMVIVGLYWAGWLIVLCSTFMINHFELFGLKQAFAQRDRADISASLVTRYLYRFVRHPIMLGFVIAFWAAPVMSMGHLVFAVMTTLYILVGIALEERDMLAAPGTEYRRYRERVPMLFPWRLRAVEERQGHGEPI